MLRTHETEIHNCLLLLLSSFDLLLNEIRQIVLCCTLACISTLGTHPLTFLLIALCEWFCLLFFPFCPSCLDSKSSGTMRYRFQCYNQKALGFSSGVRLKLLTRGEYCFFCQGDSTIYSCETLVSGCIKLGLSRTSWREDTTNRTTNFNSAWICHTQ